MPTVTLPDRTDARIVASLVTSLVVHWHRLPNGLQTAIISHASEIGFGQTDPSEPADRRVVGFIRSHQQAVRQAAPERTWAPDRVFSDRLRRARRGHDVDRDRIDGAVAWIGRLWADRRPEPADRRRSVLSESRRGIVRAYTMLERCRVHLTSRKAGAYR